MELNFDCSIDLFTKEKIELSKYKNKPFKKNSAVKSVGYNLQKAAAYYLEKYNLDFNEILDKFFDIPKCPVTNLPVTVTLSGKIKFGEFSNNCSIELRNQYIAKHNTSFLSFVEKMKIERKGKGNPVFGLKAWNNGIPMSNETKLKQKNNREKWSDEFKKEISQKLSSSAIQASINFPNRGMGGKFHSEATKEKCRAATIKRIQEGKFPQTDSLISKIFENLLIELNLPY